MPTIISGNTSVPKKMIGAKCADMTLADAGERAAPAEPQSRDLASADG